VFILGISPGEGNSFPGNVEFPPPGKREKEGEEKGKNPLGTPYLVPGARSLKYLLM